MCNYIQKNLVSRIVHRLRVSSLCNVRKIEKEHAFGAFLDIVGVFNMICYDSIKKSSSLGVNTTVITWIEMILKSRNVEAS